MSVSGTKREVPRKLTNTEWEHIKYHHVYNVVANKSNLVSDFFKQVFRVVFNVCNR